MSTREYRGSPSNTVLESNEWRACPNSWKSVSTSSWLSITDVELGPEKSQMRATICKLSCINKSFRKFEKCV